MFLKINALTLIFPLSLLSLHFFLIYTLLSKHLFLPNTPSCPTSHPSLHLLIPTKHHFFPNITSFFTPLDTLTPFQQCISQYVNPSYPNTPYSFLPVPTLHHFPTPPPALPTSHRRTELVQVEDGCRRELTQRCLQHEHWDTDQCQHQDIWYQKRPCGI